MAILFASSCLHSVHAADILQAVPTEAEFDERFEPEWEISAAPFYGWIPGMKGTVAVFGQPPVDVEVTPIEILENLDEFLDVLEGIYFGAGQVRRGKFGFVWDVIYLDVASTNEIDGDVLGGRLDVGFTQAMATLMASYRFHETSATYVDAMAGARISHVDLNVGLDLGIIGGSSSDGDTWVDLVLGLKGRSYLSDRAYVEGWGMIGGFGLASDFLWDAYGGVGYEVKDWLSVFAGFRGTGTDYQDGAFEWDVIQYGPIVGFGLRF